ncbi:MAG: protein TolQ [Alphaproteobacteria bacterium]|nr:protein TolQ [Alphaproteobacteria bacterium]
MSRFAVTFFALFFMMAAPVAPALAQQAPPSAAPTGEQAETQSLAPPPGVIDATRPSGSSAMIGSIPIVEMFRRADIVVQAVMVLLLLASLWSWTIIFNKGLALSGLKRKAKKFEKIFWSGQSLDELYQQFGAQNDHPLTAMFIAALREWRRAFESGTPRESQIAGVKDRIEKAMNVTILRETDALEKSLGFLATIGAVAPFIGLFGTVWGIMNSFSAIAARHDTTLAVVAPGIAEALFATAAGLFAAIPAVIFYNRFVNEIGRYVNSLDAFADEFSAILSRQLDEKVR